MTFSSMELNDRHLNYNPCLTLQARLAESTSCGEWQLLQLVSHVIMLNNAINEFVILCRGECGGE